MKESEREREGEEEKIVNIYSWFDKQFNAISIQYYIFQLEKRVLNSHQSSTEPHKLYYPASFIHIEFRENKYF